LSFLYPVGDNNSKVRTDSIKYETLQW